MWVIIFRSIDFPQSWAFAMHSLSFLRAIEDKKEMLAYTPGRV